MVNGRITKLAFTVSCACLISITSVGQKNFSQWYFGNGAGIDFSSGSARVNHSGSLFTDEGCASISDNNGRLLFYSDGINVYDKSHEKMPNGTGLDGDVSATQSALIVPQPGSNTLYYLFTVGEKADSKGLRYSKIDMTKNLKSTNMSGKHNMLVTPDIKISARGGDVVKKNILLKGKVTEKMAGVMHANGKDIWVIVHGWNSNRFYAYLVTETGIKDPVISSAGLTHKDYGSGASSEAIGSMQASADGSMLAVAMCYRENAPVEVFRFDKNTGIVSPKAEVPTSGFAYGLCFSPDNSKLYISFLKGDVGVMQVLVKNQSILDETTPLITNIENTFGAIQLAPDGRLYVARTEKSLDVIQNPNKFGKACDYKRAGLSLEPYGSSVYGLPNIIYGYGGVKSEEANTKLETSLPTPTPASGTTDLPESNKPLDLGGKVNGCKELLLDAGSGAKYEWSNGAISRVVKFKTSGTYWVNVFDDAGKLSASDTVEIYIGTLEGQISLGEDTILCAKSLTLQPQVSLTAYQWSNGSTDAAVEVYKTDKYILNGKDGTCNVRGEIDVTFTGHPTEFKYLPEFNPTMTFNNKFEYSINDVTAFKLEIFGRRKQTVFETTDKRQKWAGKLPSGKPAATGEYRWKVTYTPKCNGGTEQVQEGMVNLRW